VVQIDSAASRIEERVDDLVGKLPQNTATEVYKILPRQTGRNNKKSSSEALRIKEALGNQGFNVLEYLKQKVRAQWCLKPKRVLLSLRCTPKLFILPSQQLVWGRYLLRSPEGRAQVLADITHLQEEPDTAFQAFLSEVCPREWLCPISQTA